MIFCFIDYSRGSQLVAHGPAVGHGVVFSGSQSPARKQQRRRRRVVGHPLPTV